MTASPLSGCSKGLVSGGGEYYGVRLFLLQGGWVEMERKGYAGDKGDEYWSVGDGVFPDRPSNGGFLRHRTDAQVAVEYDPADILTEIGAQIDKMLAKLPTLQKQRKPPGGSRPPSLTDMK
jgi:hypothetical protein